MIAIKDDSGKFIARAVLRVLYDTEGKVSLLLERTYCNERFTTIENSLDKILIEKALEKAESLEVELISENIWHGLPALKAFTWGGGACRFFYTDLLRSYELSSGFIPGNNLILQGSNLAIARRKDFPKPLSSETSLEKINYLHFFLDVRTRP